MSQTPAGPSSAQANPFQPHPPNEQIDHDAHFALRLLLREQGLEHRISDVGPAFPSTNPAPRISCVICLDVIPLNLIVRLQPCSHYFCRPCIRQYLTVIAKDTKRFPIPCPSCKSEVDAEGCLALLVEVPASFEALQALIAEKQYMPHVRYCQNPQCATPFEWIETPGKLQYMVNCPVCDHDTCVRCNVPWHSDMTCEEFAAARKDSDNNMARLASEYKWRACPGCGHMIERIEGTCPHMKCRCGCEFCHACGVPFGSMRMNLENLDSSDGNANCSCQLYRANLGEMLRFVRRAVRARGARGGGRVGGSRGGGSGGGAQGGGSGGGASAGNSGGGASAGNSGRGAPAGNSGGGASAGNSG